MTGASITNGEKAVERTITLLVCRYGRWEINEVNFGDNDCCNSGGNGDGNENNNSNDCDDNDDDNDCDNNDEDNDDDGNNGNDYENIGNDCDKSEW